MPPRQVVVICLIGLMTGCASLRSSQTAQKNSAADRMPARKTAEHSDDQILPVSHSEPKISAAASFQRSLLFHPTKTTRLAAESSGLSQTAVDVHVTTHDNLTLNGWLVVGNPDEGSEEPDAVTLLKRDRPLVILFPGNAGHRGMRNQLIEMFGILKADVLIFDYRGYGDNPGNPAEEHLAQDARAIWNLAVGELQVPAERIVIYGESLGGAVATRMASDLCLSGIEPAGLIVQSSFNSVVDVGRHHFRMLPVNSLSVDRFDSERHIAQVTCPYMHMHGGKDEVVPIELGVKLHKAAPPMSSSGLQKKLVILSNSHHNDVYEADHRQAVAEVQRFLDQTRNAAENTGAGDSHFTFRR